MKQLKLFLIILAFAFGFVPAGAEPADSITVSYCASYVREHKLLQRGAETNVVDIDLEWPDAVDGLRADSLKRFISHQLLHVDATELAPALQRFYSLYGTEVKGQLSQIPDDSRFCYVNCKLSILGHEEGRFISFRLERTVQPEKNSTVKADTTELLFTFDLQRGSVLLQDDLLRVSRISSSFNGYKFLGQLVQAFPDGIPDAIDAMSLRQTCLIDSRILTYVTFSNQDGVYFQPAMLEAENVKQFLTKRATQLLEQKPQLTNLIALPKAETLNGEPVYYDVDVNPKYPGGLDSLGVFVGTHIDYGEMKTERKSIGRVRASFIIDAKGHPSSFRIIGSASPTIDREVVKVMRMMPTWTPAQLGGKAVATRVTLPIVVKVRE